MGKNQKPCVIPGKETKRHEVGEEREGGMRGKGEGKGGDGKKRS